MRIFLSAMLVFLIPLIAYGGASMTITSPEFRHNGIISPRFTCQGEDINPTLEISGVAGGAQSLALITDDPDAPVGVWTHWVVFDINPATTVIKENSVPGVQGWNDFRRVQWGGPCPPSGTHRYFFKLYALDKKLGLKAGASREQVERAMEGHILEKAELIGLYKKF
jgi:Raf kinase inhibitor-like YbhB/YbcL family protein